MKVNNKNWYDVIPTSNSRVIHLNFHTRYELCATMLRLQEFYESPYTNINGQYFTLKEYKSTSIKEIGRFDYYVKWSGFNIPGNTVIKFYDIFSRKLYLREKRLFHPTFKSLMNDYGDNFYIIATFGETIEEKIVQHEIAHAMYYLDSDYKDSCTTILQSMEPDDYKTVTDHILKTGYGESVMLDELQAYLSTDTDCDIVARFGGSSTLLTIAQRYRNNYLTHTKKGE